MRKIPNHFRINGDDWGPVDLFRTRSEAERFALANAAQIGSYVIEEVECWEDGANGIVTAEDAHVKWSDEEADRISERLDGEDDEERGDDL